MSNEIDFGKHLKELREEKKLSINQLSAKSGISNAQISRIENGLRGVPKPETIQKLADALNASFVDLMIVAGHFNEMSNEDKLDFSNRYTHDRLVERELVSLLKNLTDDDGNFLIFLHEDVFRLVGELPGLANPDFYNLYCSYLNRDDSEYEDESMYHEFNKHYNFRSVKDYILFYGSHVREEYLYKFKNLANKFDIKKPSLSEPWEDEADKLLLTEIKRIADKHEMPLSDPKTFELLDEALDFIKRLRSK